MKLIKHQRIINANNFKGIAFSLVCLSGIFAVSSQAQSTDVTWEGFLPDGNGVNEEIDHNIGFRNCVDNTPGEERNKNCQFVVDREGDTPGSLESLFTSEFFVNGGLLRPKLFLNSADAPDQPNGINGRNYRTSLIGGGGVLVEEDEVSSVTGEIIQTNFSQLLPTEISFGLSSLGTTSSANLLLSASSGIGFLNDYTSGDLSISNFSNFGLEGFQFQNTNSYNSGPNNGDVISYFAQLRNGQFANKEIILESKFQIAADPDDSQVNRTIYSDSEIKMEYRQGADENSPVVSDDLIITPSILRYIAFNGEETNVGAHQINTPELVANDVKAGKIITDIWEAAPDYVFKPDYKLKTLEDIESYVKKHSHLPEIPSGKTMEKEGVDLASMNLKLLKKIEEMTLHMIAMNKRIKDLENLKK